MLTNEQWKFIEDSEYEDVNRLRLSHHGCPDLVPVIDQIDCRQRAKKKLSVTLGNAPRFVFPSVLSAEQSTSDTLAAYHGSLCGESHTVLDMTCGLGIDSFHICNSNNRHVTACEINPEYVVAARYNASLLGLENIEVINTDSVLKLQSTPADSFDCIFIDPARRGTAGRRLFALSDCSPDVTSIIDRMLQVAPLIIIKASPMLDITHTLGELTNIDKIIAVGDRRDCKELVIICRRQVSSIPTLESISFTGDSHESIIQFSFHADEEKESKAIYENPSEGMILYEPYPSAIKVGGYNLMATRFGLSKVAANSHLYLSKHLATDFPGQQFNIIRVLPFNKKGIKECASILPQAEISTRNFPLKPDEIFKKLKIRSGGITRIFATRTQSNQAVLIITERIVR